ncbi:MAG: hypothetical protein K2Q26_03650 [Bdellovibrionales bacterium]|nr:hypothetical protein [Bdellovibrionales bacterium]
MKLTVCILGLACLLGCASTPRTKWTDKTMRVMIDPDSIPAEHHVMIQQALVDSGKWFVVDRSSGFRAIKTEQQRLHREESDRYEDREKWAHWGKLYGVGGIVVAHAQCKKEQGWLIGRWYQVCRQYLSIMDANTGEVITAIQTDAESSEAGFYPKWDEAVAKLNESYPANFKPFQTSERLEQYRELSKEEAQRQFERSPTGK